MILFTTFASLIDGVQCLPLKKQCFRTQFKLGRDILSVQDEDYSRNAPCELNLMSTFLLLEPVMDGG
jgi:hypothetical protein